MLKLDKGSEKPKSEKPRRPRPDDVSSSKNKRSDKPKIEKPQRNDEPVAAEVNVDVMQTINTFIETWIKIPENRYAWTKLGMKLVVFCALNLAGGTYTVQGVHHVEELTGHRVTKSYPQKPWNGLAWMLVGTSIGVQLYKKKKPEWLDRLFLDDGHPLVTNQPAVVDAEPKEDVKPKEVDIPFVPDRDELEYVSILSWSEFKHRICDVETLFAWMSPDDAQDKGVMKLCLQSWGVTRKGDLVYLSQDGCTYKTFASKAKANKEKSFLLNDGNFLITSKDRRDDMIVYPKHVLALLTGKPSSANTSTKVFDHFNGILLSNVRALEFLRTSKAEFPEKNSITKFLTQNTKSMLYCHTDGVWHVINLKEQ